MNFISIIALLCISIVNARAVKLNESIDKYDIHSGSMLEQYECYAKVMNEVSINNGEEKVWAQYYSKIQRHINNWGNCGFDVRCKRLEMVATHFTLKDYKEFVKTKNPQIVQDYEREINAKCSDNNDYQLLTKNSLEDNFENSKNLPKYFQCLANSMGLAWEANGEWAKYQPQLQIHLNNWKKCSRLANPDDRNSCNDRESHNTFDILNGCIIAMSSMNPKVLKDYSSIARNNCVQ